MSENAVDELLSAWLESGLALIDLRAEEDFQSRRLDRSISIPDTELLDDLFELPDASVPLALLGAREEVESARQQLIERGWKVST